VNVTLRPCRATDLESVHDLIHATIDASYTDVYPPRAVRFFQDYHTPQRILKRQAQGHTVVAELDSRLVATGAIVGNHIMAVFVDPHCQRHGVGAQVMDALEDMARAAGQPRVHLDVSLPSLGFYSSRGYSHMQSCSIDVGEGQRLDYWTAEKSLEGGEF